MPFRYLRDPLFLFCVALYFINRLLLKPHIHGGVIGALIHGYVNDLLCLPFWVPIMVWMMHKTHLRTGDAPPQSVEILVPLLLWSWYFKLVLPSLGSPPHLTVSDPYDILCYTIGALLANMFWRCYYGGLRKER
jgi:hypothetical protein